MNEANITSVLTSEKSGTNDLTLKSICDFPPVMKYATKPIFKIRIGTAIPPINPILEIFSVYFVPPS